MTIPGHFHGGKWQLVPKISTLRSSSSAAPGRQLHLHLLQTQHARSRIVTVHCYLGHGHPLKLRGTSVMSYTAGTLVFLYEIDKQSLSRGKHGGVKEDEALPHDISSMFKPGHAKFDNASLQLLQINLPGAVLSTWNRIDHRIATVASKEAAKISKTYILYHPAATGHLNQHPGNASRKI